MKKLKPPVAGAIKSLEEAWLGISRQTLFNLSEIAKKPSKSEPSLYEKNKNHGIYIVTDSDDENVIFIGRTNNRLLDGMSGELLKHLKGDTVLSKLFPQPAQRGQLCVRTLRINNYDYRKKAEMYGVSIYSPALSQYGRIASFPDPTELDSLTTPALRLVAKNVRK